jgi:hypothetical protein
VLGSVGHRLGRRGGALLFFAMLDLFYFFNLMFPSKLARSSGTFVFLATVVPLWTWALLWGVVGVVCLVCAFRRRDQVGFSAAIGLKVLWGLVCMGAWWWGGVERAYVTAVVWLAFAGLVGILAGWPEPNGGKGPAWTRPSR